MKPNFYNNKINPPNKDHTKGQKHILHRHKITPQNNYKKPNKPSTKIALNSKQ